MNITLRIAMCALAAMALWAQDGEIRGVVRDPEGRAVAGAVVHLKSGGLTFTAKTDAGGSYRFLSLVSGRYVLRTEFAGIGEASFGPLSLESKQIKKVDLMLRTGKAEFFDEPTFIVAGVSDGASQGGHGSDAILRSAEALAKATASLGKESSDSTPLARQAEIDERNAKPLEAVREYQRAAELDPSERNLFAWGAELLAHHAYDPAIEVFTRSHREFPKSARMLLGLAVGYYAKGAYDQAAQRFFEATDVDPADPGPYLFLARTENSEIGGSKGYAERMARFAKMQPDNGWADYYYAASLWKQKGDAAEVERLLNKALRLDPSLASAQLELGIVYADQKHFPQAIDAFQKTIEMDPHVEEAHYRLAQAYARTGEKQKAAREFELHDKLLKESAAQVERERREVRQFVIELRRPQ